MYKCVNITLAIHPVPSHSQETACDCQGSAEVALRPAKRTNRDPRRGEDADEPQ